MFGEAIVDNDENINSSDNALSNPEGDTENENNENPAWWIDDAVAGTGERPDWLPEKFKSVKAVVDAYSELERKQGTAPDEYSWEAGAEWVDPEYEPFQDLAEFAKSHKVPQAVMDKMLTTVGTYLNEFSNDTQEEMQRLGDNAKERLNVLDNWAKSNLSENSYNALRGSLRTAEGIVALEEIRNKMLDNDLTIPTGNENLGGEELSLEGVQQELIDNLEKYKTDSVYRKKLDQKIEQAVNKMGAQG